jgi:hypothetical protein
MLPIAITVVKKKLDLVFLVTIIIFKKENKFLFLVTIDVT